MASKTMEVNCDPHAPPTGFDGLGAGVGAPGVVGGDTVTETVTFANPGVCWMAFVKACTILAFDTWAEIVAGVCPAFKVIVNIDVIMPTAERLRPGITPLPTNRLRFACVECVEFTWSLATPAPVANCEFALSTKVASFCKFWRSARGPSVVALVTTFPGDVPET